MRRAALVLWRLRGLSLFLIGPAVGVALGGLIFGMPLDLRWAAGAMFALSLTLFGILARSEWRLIGREAGARRPGR